MGYAKVNYDDIYAASPINGTAASVVTGKVLTISEVDEAYHQFDVLNRRLKKATLDLRKIDVSNFKHLTKRQIKVLKEPLRQVVDDITAERDELIKKYPFVKKHKKRELQSFILDQLKEIVTESQWKECVRKAKQNMKIHYLAGDE